MSYLVLKRLVEDKNFRNYIHCPKAKKIVFNYNNKFDYVIGLYN